MPNRCFCPLPQSCGPADAHQPERRRLRHVRVGAGHVAAQHQTELRQRADRSNRSPVCARADGGRGLCARLSERHELALARHQCDRRAVLPQRILGCHHAAEFSLDVRPDGQVDRRADQHWGLGRASGGPRGRGAFAGGRQPEDSRRV